MVISAMKAKHLVYHQIQRKIIKHVPKAHAALPTIMMALRVAYFKFTIRFITVLTSIRAKALISRPWCRLGCHQA